MNKDGVALNETSQGGHLTFILLILLAMFPLMQLGISYYLSFQMLAFSLVLLALNAQAIKKNIKIGFILFVLMMLPNVYFAGREQFFHYILVSARSFLCLYVMLTVFDMARMKPFNLNKKPLKIAVNLLILFLFLSVVLQSILLKQGVLLTAPAEYLIANIDTLPGEFELEHGRSLIRPSSTFGEASYLGFISLSLFVIVMYLFQKSRMKSILLVLLFATLVMAQTLSGLLSLALILAVHGSRYLSRRQIGKSIAVLSMVALGVFVLAYLGHLSILERLFNIFDPDQEFSGYIRLVAPIVVAMRVFENYFIFGMPLEELQHIVDGMGLATLISASDVTNNGLLNLFMSYGVTAVLIIWVVSRKMASPVLLVYLLLSSIFNGALFSFDKTVVFAVVFLLTNVLSCNSWSQKARVPL